MRHFLGALIPLLQMGGIGEVVPGIIIVSFETGEPMKGMYLRQVHGRMGLAVSEAISQPCKHVHGIFAERSPYEIFVAWILKQIEIVQTGSRVERDDRSRRPSVLERTRAAFHPHCLLHPLEGMCFPRINDLRFRLQRGIIFRLQFVEKFSDVARDMLNRANNRAVTKRTHGTHKHKIVGHVLDRDTQVAGR